MGKQTIEALVDGGKASAGPPLGPALGPAKVNVKDVIDNINEKTKDFAGMKIPVKVIIDTETKKFKIEVGSPSVSQLIKKETKLEKLSQKPGSEIVADLTIDQILKIAKMKESSLFAKTRLNAAKIVLGTCLAAGITVDGKDPREVIKEINSGNYDSKVNE